ncbi:MAG: transcriptional repressor LexA [Desulfocapsaceae bacterium]|nr:transcriptional repressor LexA [Desulfocapsaceae bacterium]
MELTEKQEYFLAYLKEKITAEGRAPSLREAAQDMGISHTAVAQMLQQLERKGVLERDGHYSRTVRLTGEDGGGRNRRRGRELPVIGRITAGLPMYAQQEWDGTVIVDGSRFNGDNLFCLRIQGNSMQGAGILDGDLVICEPRQYAENGEIVAALINGEEATVKRFFLRADHIEMRPENAAYQTMSYSFGELLVQGKVIGVLRDRVDDHRPGSKS